MTRRRALTLTALGLAALLLAGLVAHRLALHQLRAAILQTLGPRASLDGIRLGLSGVEMQGLRVRGTGSDWPADDELRAARVHVQPDLASLLGDAWRVHSVTLDDAYVSVLRQRGGGLRALAALQPPPPRGDAQRRPLRIDQLRLRNTVVDFYDASVHTPPHRLRLEQLNTEVGPLVLPALDEPAEVELTALLKGPQRDGRLALQGEVTRGKQDARLAIRLQGADLVALQPYLFKLHDGGVRRGTLDLTLDVTLQNKRLNAPGRVVLTGLELADDTSIVGLPRLAVLSAMQRDGRIELDFVVEGQIDDPKFSLNEGLVISVTTGLARALGLTVGGVVDGVGSLIKGLFGR